MTEKTDRDTTLPVTAEVGSEGGSFADATTQVSTLEGDVPQVRGTAGAAAAPPAGGILRYPTEPPPGATEGRRRSGTAWKTGLAGAAAGAAVALALSALHRRP